TLQLLETQGWLADDALIYVESEVENGLPPVPANWALYREKVADSHCRYAHRVDGAGHW
ncbi:RsmD family RNA methyltransferase, partial [Salmonella enterica subsp. enterica serovar Montevideo]|nr:RsmD family RNA methyltransferase [Salmonella enterica subsp. enterica serovar Montevideo]